MNRLLMTMLISAGVGFAGVANAADDHATMSRDAYKAEKDRISTAYKADREHCRSMSGNAKDICIAEAKGHEKVAKAELDAKMKNTERARYDVRIAKADAEYDVAKERCDDRRGNDKDVCVKEAKAQYTRAKADAKVAKAEGDPAAVQSARRDAAEDKRDADYKVAKERCDSLKGDAKDRCVQDAKARFGHG
jgi:hypothetical protein